MSDLIRRGDVIEVLTETIAPPSVTLDTLVMRIDALPSAEARPTGEWIPEQDTGETMLKCSECGCRVIEKWYRMAVGTNADRCPYCGRKLVD